jgi:nicotinate-nucleotide adenylyltransferase
MGGTFDPIHFGHLFIAEEARVRCGLSRVIFFPNRQPAHREGKSANADPETRYKLTQLGIGDNPHFDISRVELDRAGPSYAIDTVQQLQVELGVGAELFFIAGADSVGDILTWYHGAELFELCRFVALSRPGFSLEAAQQELSPQQLGRVVFLETIGLDIASREIRQRVRENLPIRYLTPDVVERSIQKQGLYK